MTAFDDIAALVKRRSGLALGPDKIYLFETRLMPIARRLGLPDYTGVAPLLQADPGLQDEVVEALTTNETLFFRDRRIFDHLHAQSLPRLHGRRPAGVPLRVWCAGVSTGQEAYSVAMQVSQAGSLLQGRDVRILGTDIARGTLARARTGLYSQFEVQRGLPASLLIKYFGKEAEGWRIIKPIQDMTEFREWNLLDDAVPLGRFDIILCRNVLIYFDEATRSRVLAMIARRLAADGLLYLGGTETISASPAHSFSPVPGEHSAYTLSCQQRHHASAPVGLPA